MSKKITFKHFLIVMLSSSVSLVATASKENLVAQVSNTNPTIKNLNPFSDSNIKTLYSFDGYHGADPKGSLTLVDVNGIPTLFGRTSAGGPSWKSKDPSHFPGAGIFFRLSLDGKQFSMLPLTAKTGYDPHHDSMLLFKDTLYGAVLYSGANFDKESGNGDIFSINPSNLSFTKLHHFIGAPVEGANSHSCQQPSSDGETLYGATAKGCSSTDDASCSSNNNGTLYRYNVLHKPSYQTLFSFLNGTGSSASSCLNCTGSIPHGHPTVINIGTKQHPIDILLGITRQGGLTTDGNSDGDGTIYAFAPDTKTYTVLHLFSGQNGSNLAESDGAYTDHGNLVIGKFTQARKNKPAQVTVYGMTTYGGSGTETAGSSNSPGSGVIFTMTIDLPVPTTTPPSVVNYQIIHDFGGASVENLSTQTLQSDGYNPYGSPTLANGWIYGMTRNGGANHGGVIFRMNPDSSCVNSNAPACYGLLGVFDSPNSGDTDLTGSQPIDNVIVSHDGKTLYGMTQTGGAHDPTNQEQDISFGTVFSIPTNEGH